MPSFTITFGPMADPIANQVRTQLKADGRRMPAGLAKALEPLERDVQAINRLGMRGLLPDRPRNQARDRVMKQVTQVLAKHFKKD